MIKKVLTSKKIAPGYNTPSWLQGIFAVFMLLTGISASVIQAQVMIQFKEPSCYLQGISFTDSLTGWAVGLPHWNQAAGSFIGTVLKTGNGGRTWLEQNPGVSVALRKVKFINALTGWAVGGSGVILKTADGGSSWSRQNIATTDEVRCVMFISSSTGWVSSVMAVHQDFYGEDDDWRSSVWKTSDGGISWTKQNLPSTASIINGIEFTDGLSGWAVGTKYAGNDQYGKPVHHGSIYHTSDGGLTWAEQVVPNPQSADQPLIVFTAVDFVNSARGWATCFKTVSTVEGGSMYHTTDGGVTWVQDTAEATLGAWKNLWDIQFTDSNRGYAVGTLYGAAWGPPVLRTTDGGLHWELVHMESQNGEGLFGVAVMDNKVIAVGDHDYIVHSYNPWGVYGLPYGENLFRQRYLNPHYTFEDIVFTDKMNGWVAGQMVPHPDSACQVIMHTSDGGSTWQKQFTSVREFWPAGVPRLDKLFFTDKLTGWAFGGSKMQTGGGSFILHTSDGGMHWNSQDAGIPPLKRELYSGFFINIMNGWALEKGGDGSYPYILTLLKTNNGGSTWTRISTGISGSWGVGFANVQGDIFFSDSNNGWAGGYSGGVIHTTDGGMTWTKQNYPAYAQCDALYFINNLQGWAADGTSMQYTGDGGNTWTRKTIPSLKGSANDVHFSGTISGWIVGNKGTIAQTRDGGNSWEDLNPDNAVTSNLLGLHFMNDTLGWAAGEGGTILRIISNDIITSAGIRPGSEKDDGIIIFPNPARERVNIRMTETSPARLQIINLNGQVLIDKFSNDEIEKMDLSSLPGGIYFVKVAAGKKVTLRKLIVESKR
jgi:photosystem II stability/assembly factor-like uncharacterized protein